MPSQSCEVPWCSTVLSENSADAGVLSPRGSPAHAALAQRPRRLSESRRGKSGSVIPRPRPERSLRERRVSACGRAAPEGLGPTGDRRPRLGDRAAAGGWPGCSLRRASDPAALGGLGRVVVAAAASRSSASFREPATCRSGRGSARGVAARCGLPGRGSPSEYRSRAIYITARSMSAVRYSVCLGRLAI